MPAERRYPIYLNLGDSGELKRRAEEAVSRLRRCFVCPQACGVNRLEDEIGFCHSGRMAAIASASPHFGEEPPLVGEHGSGTIFFSGCNLACVFCQNCEISQEGEGDQVSPEKLAQTMLRLQGRGCHNINLVSPSHVAPQILEALAIAADEGLNLPLVYNSGGYDSLKTLELLDGVVDIYMPDIKFTSEEASRKYARAQGYPTVARRAIQEMHRQVGDLVLDEDGVAVRGLIIRHLVLPGALAGTAEVVSFVADEISRDTYFNLMDQYYPAHRAAEFPPLHRRIDRSEYREARRLAREAGLRRLAD